MPHHLIKQGTDSRLLQISRNFTHGVGNVCKEPYPSPWKQARQLTLKHQKLPTGFPKALSGERQVQKASGIWRRNLQFDWSKHFNWGSLGLPALISTGSPCLVSEVHTTFLKSVILSLNLNFKVAYAALGNNTQLTIFSNLITFYLWETAWYQYTIP